MAENTPNLNLYKKNPATDGDDTFNIETVLNENWDRVDEHAGDNVRHVTAAERTDWNAKETTAGAQAKADAAQSAAISAAAADATTKAAAVADASIPLTQKGAASGVATLDATIKIPAGQLPVSAVQATTADVTYYVRTDGNDNNNGLTNTAAGAFKTIAKALSMIPPVINHTTVVNVAAGTYAEDVEIKGFSGSGVLQVNPGVVTVSNTYNVSSVTVSNCLIPVGVNGLNATTVTARAFTALSALDAEFKYCSTTLGMVNQHGFYANSAKMYLYHCTATNKYAGISAGQNSEVFVWDCSGTGNAIALYAGEGGRISTTGTVPAGTTASATGNGGSIDTNGVINSWGDNTAAQRSHISSRMSADQAITASSFTKVAFDSPAVDHLSEYSWNNRRFTARKSGIYLVGAAVQSTGSTPAGAVLVMSVYKNGGRYRDMGTYVKSGAIGEILTQGAVSLELAAGDYIEIWVYTNVSGMVLYGNVDGVLNHFTVTQIA
ncbi:hypothetical protein KIH86_07520 [Paenibacillus sp. HN-1]|uniref:hypothetical protein n=1 Tax=Paenibacillus TaxID=44249 RepID=UPI001CA93761|nr:MULTISPECIES: hypothetical protein [Paenibacillus]MBY9080986.1 hypothetical protein [Paenibacillus sp. CGMCC 1.18879]MBY9084088.1 hypothetical protein [Paenibacillus sinensis]